MRLVDVIKVSIRSMGRSVTTPGSASSQQHASHYPTPPHECVGLFSPYLPDHSDPPDATNFQYPNTSPTPLHVAELLNIAPDDGANLQPSEVQPIFSTPADTRLDFDADIFPTKLGYDLCSPTEQSFPSFKFGPPGSIYLPLVVEGTVFDVCYPPGKSTKGHRKLFDTIIREDEVRRKWYSRCLNSIRRTSVAPSDSFRLDSRWSSTSELNLWTHPARLIDGDLPFPLPTNYPLSPSPYAFNTSAADLIRPESVGDRYPIPSSISMMTRSMAKTPSDDPLGDSPCTKEDDTITGVVRECVNTQDPQIRATKQQRRRGIV